MLFVIVGVLLVACNLLDIGPPGHWNWEISGDLWKFVLPFVLAIGWWMWSDATGWTKRKAMNKDDQRKRDRIDRNIDAMGLGHLHKHRDGKTRPKR